MNTPNNQPPASNQNTTPGDQPAAPADPFTPANPEPAPSPKKKHMALSVMIATLLIVALAVAAYVIFFNNKQTLDTPKNSSDALMIVKYVGGLCPNGNVCSQEYKVYADGTFEGHTRLSSSEVSRLKETIDTTDFLQYKENPSPACASAYDGADEVLAFPGKYSDTSFTLCELQIPNDDTAVAFIKGLIEAHKEQ